MSPRLITGYLARHWIWCVGWMVAMVVSTASTLALPLYVRKAVEAADDHSTMASAFFVVLAIGLFLAVSTSLRYLCVATLGDRAASDIRVGLFTHLLGRSMAFFRSIPSADISARISADVESLQALLGGGISIALRSAILAVGASCAMIMTSPVLSAVSAMVLPLSAFSLLPFGRKVRLHTHQRQAMQGAADDFAYESFSTIHLVKAYTIEQQRIAAYREIIQEATTASRARTVARSGISGSLVASVMVVLTFALWIGALQISSGVLLPSQLGQFVVYAFVLASAVIGFADSWGDLMQLRGVVDRLNMLYELDVSKEDDSGGSFAASVKDAIQFNGVSFAYPGARESVFRDLSFRITAGESVAFVGPSGAGKSTLFGMLMGFVRPDSGTITIDGIPIDAVSRSELRKLFAFVPQDAAALATTVAENIAMDLPIDDDRLHDAAVRADAHAFISRMDQGYQTKLGERGNSLSGGQRQRLAVARALYRKAEILLLDEATSALDATSESVVQKALRFRTSGQTTVVIAHKLATVVLADRIFVLDGGGIVASGTHSQLFEECVPYARWAHMQGILMPAVSSESRSEIS